MCQSSLLPISPCYSTEEGAYSRVGNRQQTLLEEKKIFLAGDGQTIMGNPKPPTALKQKTLKDEAGDFWLNPASNLNQNLIRNVNLLLINTTTSLTGRKAEKPPVPTRKKLQEGSLVRLPEDCYFSLKQRQQDQISLPLFLRKRYEGAANSLRRMPEPAQRRQKSSLS